LLLLLRLLVVAPTAAALELLQRPWLLQWVLFLATLWALLLAASAVLFFCYSFGRSCRLRQLALLLACFWGCSYDGCCFGCCFHVTADAFFTFLLLFLMKVRRRVGLLSSRLPGTFDYAFLGAFLHAVARDLTCP
jgi:hypothetical protein